MRRATLLAVRSGLLAGPVALAFFSGGYFATPRLVAAVAAWALLAVALVATARAGDGAVSGRRGSGPAVVALGALALLAAWTAVSAARAPAGLPASAALELTLLYLGAVAAATAAFGSRAAARGVEPAIAAGVLVVVGYGLAGRFLPGVVDPAGSASAGGRLDQPLSYWNAEGALAALGLLLCARIAGDRSRPVAMRAAAAAGATLLGLGVYLSFSRGALSALGVGLAVLLALAPSWAQVRSAAIALEGAAILAMVAAVLPSVRESTDNWKQGAVLLLASVVVMAAAAALQAWSARAEEEGTTRLGALPRAGAVRRVAVGAAVVLTLLPFAGAAIGQLGDDEDGAAFGARTERLASVESRRFDYWQAALAGFAEAPLVGQGAGSFPSIWLEHRDIAERALDAHSLELETLAELGLIGLAFLLLAFGGVAAAARRASEVDPVLAAGPVAALALFAAHSAIDWDWEMPALTLPVAVLAGVVLAAGSRKDLPAER